MIDRRLRAEKHSGRPNVGRTAAAGTCAIEYPLSTLDQLYLDLERAEVPMQVGALCLLSASRSETGRVLRVLGRRLTDRSAIHPLTYLRLSRRTGGRYAWRRVDRVDLRRHLETRRLSTPHDLDALMNVALRETRRLLDHRLPLWRIVLISGPDPDEIVGLVAISHHAAVDWYGFIHWLETLFDPGTPRRTAAPQASRAPARPVLAAISDRLKSSTRGWASAARLAAGGALTPPVLPFSAPRTALNGPVTTDRPGARVQFDLDRLDRVRKPIGATINDVVLTLSAGALRRYLDAHHRLPRRPAVALVPVADPSRALLPAMGNHVSPMLVPLATHLRDPLGRLRAIKRAATSAKALHATYGGRLWADVWRWWPPRLASSLLAKSVRWPDLLAMNPSSNLTITNFRGPDAPYRLAGYEVDAYLPLPLTYDGLGPTVAAHGYAGRLSICVSACRAAMPDLDGFVTELAESLAELEAAAGSAATGGLP